MPFANMHVFHFSGKLSLWCVRQYPVPKEPAGERYALHTGAYTHTEHYLFIRLKWTALWRVFWIRARFSSVVHPVVSGLFSLMYTHKRTKSHVCMILEDITLSCIHNLEFFLFVITLILNYNHYTFGTSVFFHNVSLLTDLGPQNVSIAGPHAHIQSLFGYLYEHIHWLNPFPCLFIFIEEPIPNLNLIITLS